MEQQTTKGIKLGTVTRSTEDMKGGSGKEIIIPYQIVFNKQSLFPVITSYIKEGGVVEWELKYKPRLGKCIYDISCVGNSLDEMLYKATDKLFNLYANGFDAYFYFPKQKGKNTTKK